MAAKNKSNKLKFYPLEDDIFCSGLTVVTGDFKKFVDFIKDRFGIDIKYSKTIQGKYLHLVKDSDERILIWFNSLEPKWFTMINHEVGHFVFDILNNERSTPHTDDTDEVYEYYRQYILKKIFALK